MKQSNSSATLAKLNEKVGDLSKNHLKKLRKCPKLASLHSIFEALGSLLESDHAYLSQIAELIGRDPPLTSRLLKLVNSMLYAMDLPCANIEEATLAAGLDKISELILSTPVIEDLQQLHQADTKVEWTQFWKHSIATAILSREIFAHRKESNRGDVDYIAGLIHNVGKIIFALLFPEKFTTLACRTYKDKIEETEAEYKIAGADHAVLGAYYLNANRFPVEIVESTLCHLRPSQALEQPDLSATVQLASNLARLAGIAGIEKLPRPEWADIEKLEGWAILFQADSCIHLRQALDPTLEQLSFFLDSMV
jgi:HD-like signal output (HDOD) protein